MINVASRLYANDWSFQSTYQRDFIDGVGSQKLVTQYLMESSIPEVERSAINGMIIA